MAMLEIVNSLGPVICESWSDQKSFDCVVSCDLNIYCYDLQVKLKSVLFL